MSILQLGPLSHWIMMAQSRLFSVTQSYRVARAPHVHSRIRNHLVKIVASIYLKPLLLHDTVEYFFSRIRSALQGNLHGITQCLWKSLCQIAGLVPASHQQHASIVLIVNRLCYRLLELAALFYLVILIQGNSINNLRVQIY